MQYDAAALINCNEEVATSETTRPMQIFLVFVRGELHAGEEEKDEIEVEEEPPACPTSFEVDKAITTLQEFALFVTIG